MPTEWTESAKSRSALWFLPSQSRVKEKTKELYTYFLEPQFRVRSGQNTDLLTSCNLTGEELNQNSEKNGRK